MAPRMIDGGAEYRAQVVGVGGADDRQLGDRAQHAQILQRVMAGAVETHRHAGMVPDHAHRHARIGAVGPDLLGAEDARRTRRRSRRRGYGPEEAMPAAAVIMFFSAMPKSKKRSGCRRLNSMVRLAEARSAVSTTMRGSRSARSASSSPSDEGRQAGAPASLDGGLSLVESSPPPMPRKRSPCSCACGVCAPMSAHGPAPVTCSASGRAASSATTSS